jgi:hypothetical protein
MFLIKKAFEIIKIPKALSENDIFKLLLKPHTMEIFP